MKGLLDLGLEFEINYKSNKMLLKNLKIIRFVLKNNNNDKENDSGSVRTMYADDRGIPVGSILPV